ncbi:MAG: 1-phosphofructokinase family hexose kinase [Chitinivibrionales bacterium]|nr:1-phosphofructokinase family hexose kinase [Chitinivibrionales bacterium]
MIHCTLLNPAIDVLYTVSEFQSGATLTDLDSQIIPAGKGLNVARVVKTLGENVAVAGIMMEENQAQFLRFCDEHGIKNDFFTLEGAVRVNATIMETRGDQISHLNSRGKRLGPAVAENVLAFLKKKVVPDDIWSFSGSLPDGFSDEFYRRIIKHCKKNSVTTLLDTRDNALRMGVMGKPDMIKPNIAELEGYFGEQVQGTHHIALKAKRLLDRGVGYAFISLGGDGMIALHENDCLLCSLPQIKAVDTVGCGDALVAGLLVGFARRFSFPEMCRMALACGASKAMHAGTGIIVRDEVWQLMEDIKIESV